MGLWKGAGLSLLLDMLAVLLSGGLATHEISSKEVEFASQVFITIDIFKLGSHSSITKSIENILNDYQQSVPVDEKRRIVYPGQQVLETRKHNLENGIPVLKEVWETILSL
jgi:3-dehydro-L-gulonate 2-dehydrogenase